MLNTNFAMSLSDPDVIEGFYKRRLHGQLQHLPGRVGRTVGHRAPGHELPGAPGYQRRLDGERLRDRLLVVSAAAAGGASPSPSAAVRERVCSSWPSGSA